MILNGVEYKNVPVTFNTVCQLEEMGVSISDMEGRAMSTVRAYTALCTGKSVEDAGALIEQHIINGGSVTEIVTAFGAEMEKSDFFRAIAKQAATQTTQKASSARKSKNIEA